MERSQRRRTTPLWADSVEDDDTYLSLWALETTATAPNFVPSSPPPLCSGTWPESGSLIFGGMAGANGDMEEDGLEDGQGAGAQFNMSTPVNSPRVLQQRRDRATVDLELRPPKRHRRRNHRQKETKEIGWQNYGK